MNDKVGIVRGLVLKTEVHWFVFNAATYRLGLNNNCGSNSGSIFLEIVRSRSIQHRLKILNGLQTCVTIVSWLVDSSNCLGSTYIRKYKSVL